MSIEKHLPFRVTSKDIGATQAATIWLGDTEVATFRTFTRHEELSVEFAQDLLLEFIKRSFWLFIKDRPYTDIVPFAPTDDEEDGYWDGF